MTGGTTFNSDLFGAEHLMIEDDAGSTDLRARRHFGALLKQVTACETQRHHGKNKNALTLTPFWRLSITLNDEPENLMVLPPLDESLMDKVILLKAAKYPMPMSTNGPEEKAAFWKVIETELPAMLYAIQNWEVPPELHSDRYGIAHFHHPALIQSVNELAPEAKLLSLLDEYLLVDQEKWEGTATELEDILRGMAGGQADRIFTWPTACGGYLSKLMNKLPLRISYRRSHGSSKIWTVLRGAEED